MIINLFIFIVVFFIFFRFKSNTDFYNSILPDELENRIDFATVEPGCFDTKLSDILKIFPDKQILQNKLRRIGFPASYPLNDSTAPLIASELTKRGYSFNGWCLGHPR